MEGIHRTSRDPRKWNMFFLDEDEFEAEKQMINKGSDEIIFLPNYEYDEDDELRIEDYSEIENYYRVQEIEKWMNYVASIASKSVCQKSQRGAVVVRENTIISQAFNGPVSGEQCQPCLRTNIHDNTQFEICNGIHAEGTAVKEAEKVAGNLDGARLYYIKTRNGRIIPSGDYAYVECSSIILDSGINEVVLWHADSKLKDERVIYEPNAFDDETGDPESVYQKIGIQTAHFVIYSARKLHEFALQYVK